MKPTKYKRFEIDVDCNNKIYGEELQEKLDAIIDMGYQIHTYQEFERDCNKIKIVVLCVRYSEPLIF